VINQPTISVEITRIIIIKI